MTTTLLGRLHSTRQAATDARHTRERRPLHNRHSRAGGNPAVRSGTRPINSVSPPRCRRPGRSSVAGRGAIQLDLPPRRFRLGGRNDDYTLLGRLHSTRQAATDSRHTRERRPLHNRHSRAGGYPAVRRGIRPINSVSPPRRRRAGRSLSPAWAPFSSTSHPVDSGSGAGMTTTLLGRLHSTRQAATDSPHTRERRPLHNRHSRAGGNPAVRSGTRPVNSVSPPRRRRTGRSLSRHGRHSARPPHPVNSGSGAGMTTTLLGRLHSARQTATDSRHTRERRPLHNRHSRAGGNPAIQSGIRPINSVSPPRHRRAGRSLSPAWAPFSSTSHPVDSGAGAGMTTTLLGRLHSTLQAATDARHIRERRPLHNRHSRAGGNPAVRSGIRPVNSVSPPRCRRPGRSSVAGRGAIQLDLPTP